MNRRLYRSSTDSLLGGVAGGVAEYLDVDPSIVRIVWAILAIVTGGIFFVLYIVMWIVVPQAPPGYAAAPPPYQPGPGAMPGWTPPAGEAAATPPAEGAAEAPGETPPPAAAPEAGWTSYEAAGGHPPRHRRRGSGGAMFFGLILVLLGAWFLIDEYVPGIDSDLLWPAALVVLGLALLFVAMRRNEG